MERVSQHGAGEGAFRWNGRTIESRPGDTIASALWRAGVTSLARSRKLHRHLGFSGSYPAGVLARVDGRPNVRLDQVAARRGMNVETQNTWPSGRFDLLDLAQLIPARAVYGGFEHGRWMPRSGVAFRLAERLMAQLAGVARPAERGGDALAVSGARRVFDCLVVGGGPAGIAEANRRAVDGARVALVTRGAQPARFAAAMGVPVEALDARVELFADMEIFGVYREGRLLVGAPHDPARGALVFEPAETILAMGRRSIPPLVKGHHLPGVLEAGAALHLASAHRIKLGETVAVVGTGAEAAIAERLRALGINVVHIGPVAEVTEIIGTRRISSLVAGRKLDCDVLVHAGPWRVEPSLGFQASADGLFQMEARPLPECVRVVGSAALGDEPIAASRSLHRDTLICPCMDVTAGELHAHIDAGETDPEVLKRLTSCGMGTCQGFPCWEHMLALLSVRLGDNSARFARPTHRPPRRAITVAQAAGLAGLVEPER